MSDSKKPAERVAITAAIPTPDGPVREPLPSRFLIVGDNILGDADTRYATASPTAVSRANIAKLGGLVPELHGVEVQDHLVGGEGSSLLIERLAFHSSPDNWVAEIIEQVPSLQALRHLLEALFEAQRNPRLRAQLAKWLAEQPEAGAALAQLAQARSTKPR